MSGQTETPRPAAAGKTMSSRLLTMKFMQRAAASVAPPSKRPSPYQSNSNTPGDRTPSFKRQRLSESDTFSLGLTPVSTSSSHHSTPGPSGRPVTTPTDEKGSAQLQIRSGAAFANGGETEWVLNLPLPQQIQNGGSRGQNYNGFKAEEEREDEDGEIGHEEDSWDEEEQVDRSLGRHSYGNFKKNRRYHTASHTSKPTSTAGAADPDEKDEPLSSASEEDEDDGENDPDSSSDLPSPAAEKKHKPQTPSIRSSEPSPHPSSTRLQQHPTLSTSTLGGGKKSKNKRKSTQQDASKREEDEDEDEDAARAEADRLHAMDNMKLTGMKGISGGFGNTKTLGKGLGGGGGGRGGLDRKSSHKNKAKNR